MRLAATLSSVKKKKPCENTVTKCYKLDVWVDNNTDDQVDDERDYDNRDKIK